MLKFGWALADLNPCLRGKKDLILAALLACVRRGVIEWPKEEAVLALMNSETNDGENTSSSAVVNSIPQEKVSWRLRATRLNMDETGSEENTIKNVFLSAPAKPDGKHVSGSIPMGSP